MTTAMLMLLNSPQETGM